MKLSVVTWALALVSLIQAQINPWQARHGMTSDEFQTTFDNLTSQGYRLNYVSGYTIDNIPAFAAIWEQKPSPAWAAFGGLTSDQYQATFDQYVSQGFRPVLVNGYTVNGVDNYVAIFDQSPSGAWVSLHGMTSDAYQTFFNNYTSQGYRLIHVSGYAVDNQAMYAAIWQKNSDTSGWVAFHGMTSDTYQAQLDTLSQEGYTLILVSGYQVNGVDFYAAIWEQSSGVVLYQNFNMTSDEYQREFDNAYYQGYMLKVVSGYDTGTTDLYAAIWTNPVIPASTLAAIDNPLEAYVTKNQVPGLSVAITKDDRLVFAKGYGFADREAGAIVSPNTLFRVMSISKSITATTIMSLIQAGHFKITDHVFGPGSITGTKYGTTFFPGVTNITIQNLLEHTSGYGDGSDPEGLLRTQTPDQAVTKTMATVPLAASPGTVYYYSNLGFLILGRVIATVTEQEYESYVKSSILSPCGISTMQLANDTGSVPNEVQYYPLGVSNGWRIHEFEGFGGWIASPIDLLRLSTHVDGLPQKPDILSPATEAVMWTASALNPTYGKGWIVNLPWRGHNGAFLGTGSFFIQRTDGMSFAVVVNTLVSGDEGAWELAGIVNDLIDGIGSWPAYDLF